MPHRLSEFRAKIQFVTSARMPSDIYKACLRTDTISNTAYIQHAVCEALSRDLGIPLPELLDALPPNRAAAKCLFNPDRKPIPGPGNTAQDVR